MSYAQFMVELKAFYKEREWDQFHSPKNLVMDLAAETGELLEHFCWLTEAESYKPEKIEDIKEEIGDIYMVLCSISEKLGIDPLEAAKEKLVKIGAKYPVHRAKGSRKKYTEL